MTFPRQTAERRVEVAKNLLEMENRRSFLDLLVTSDEKWIFSMNQSIRNVLVTRGQQVPRPKPSRFQKKFILCVWWCSGGLVHCELLPAGKTANADLNNRQLTTVMEKLRQLSRRTTARFRPCLLHDNAASHTANLTKETLESPGFRVLPHPPYYPDLAQFDFLLSRSLQWFLRDKTLETEKEVKSALDDFFASKNMNC